MVNWDSRTLLVELTLARNPGDGKILLFKSCSRYFFFCTSLRPSLFPRREDLTWADPVDQKLNVAPWGNTIL